MHPFHLPDWAVARGQGLNRFDALEPGATALVVIDMQSAFVGESEVFGKASSRATIPAINALCSALRTFGAPVMNKGSLGSKVCRVQISSPVLASIAMSRPSIVASKILPFQNAMPRFQSHRIFNRSPECSITWGSYSHSSLPVRASTARTTL